MERSVNWCNVGDVVCSNDEVDNADNYANVFRVAEAIDVEPYNQPIEIGIDSDVCTSLKFIFN